MQKTFFLVLISTSLVLFTRCNNKETADAENSSSDTIIEENDPIAFLTDSTGEIIKPKEGQIILQFNPPTGKKYVTNMRTTTRIKQSMMGQVFESYMDVSTGNTITVKSNSENEPIVLVSTVNSFKTIMKQDTMTAEFENGKASSDPEIDMMRQILDCYINMPVSISMDRAAEVTEIKGVQEIQEKISSKLGQEAMMASMQMSDLNQEVINSFVAFPYKPVGKGDTWVSVDSVDLGGFPTVMTSTYTLKSFDDEFAYVDVYADFKIDQKMMQQLGAESGAVKMSGYQKGGMKVVITSGWSVQSNLEQNLSLSVNAEGQQMTVNISGNSSMNAK
jgi:hypothetical protein